MNVAVRTRVADAPAPEAPSLAGRLTALGAQMLKLAGEISRAEAAGKRGDEAIPADSTLLAVFAEELYRNRRRRARHLPSRLLGEPAWDIMLDLYAAAGRGQPVSVSNACLAADVPASTALRWISHLEDEGLIERVADETDARRHYVRLTEAGLARMTAYFGECRADLLGEVAAP